MTTVDLYATDFDDDTIDLLVGRFEAGATGVQFTPAGGTEPVSDEEFNALYGVEYGTSDDEGNLVLVSSKSDPEAYVKGLPDRFASGYAYAQIVPE